MAGWDKRGSTRAWRTIRALVLLRDNYQCQIRGPRCKGRADSVDHIIAKKDGGTDDLSNLRAACGTCNYGRRDTEAPKARPYTRW